MTDDLMDEFLHQTLAVHLHYSFWFLSGSVRQLPRRLIQIDSSALSVQNLQLQIKWKENKADRRPRTKGDLVLSTLVSHVLLEPGVSYGQSMARTVVQQQSSSVLHH